MRATRLRSQPVENSYSANRGWLSCVIADGYLVANSNCPDTDPANRADAVLRERKNLRDLVLKLLGLLGRLRGHTWSPTGRSAPAFG